MGNKKLILTLSLLLDALNSEARIRTVDEQAYTQKQNLEKEGAWPSYRVHDTPFQNSSLQYLIGPYHERVYQN